MTVSTVKTAVLALGVALGASTAHGATLGLNTTGPVDTGTLDVFDFGIIAALGDLAAGGPSSFFFAGVNDPASTFDSLGEIAQVTDAGFVGNILEFELSPFDSYTNGALLTLDVTGASLGADPISGLIGSGLFLLNAPITLQAIDLGVQPIPLPAGALLLGTALAGFGFGFRRRAA